MKLGILALQGDFHAHGEVFENLGVPWRKVVKAGEFEDIDGLVIPGGESTTLLKLLTPDSKQALLRFVQRGGAVYGTCAGAILLSRRTENPVQEGLGLLDTVMIRNSYGRQVDSFMIRSDDRKVESREGEPLPRELVFIRAPVFKEVGPACEVLARVRGDPVYVRQGAVMATTFHPELTDDPSIHLRFLTLVEETRAARSRI